MLGLEAQVGGFGHHGLGAHARHHILGGQGQVGGVFHPATGQCGHGVGQLQHGEVVVTLADAQRNGLTGVPALVLGPFVGVALPFLAGQHTAHFAAQVNAGDLPEAQRFHEVVHQVHPHLAGQRVVIGVARLDDAQAHVHRAQPAVAVAAKTVVAKHPVTGIVDDGARAAGAGFQRRQCHERFVGGARWVGAAQRPVQQRFFQRLVERFPVLHVDAFDEQVGVEGGLAHKRQHLAVARIDGHQRTPALPKHVFHQLLQLDVNGQHHRVARGGGRVGQRAHGAPACRGFDPLEPGDAVQLALKALLGAELANVFGAPVVGLVFVGPFFDAGLLSVVDAPDVANHVARHLPVRVLADQPRPHIDTRKAVALRRETGHLFVAQAGAQGQ